MSALDRLRTIAEQACAGPWEALGGYPQHVMGKFIATFDPETVLALLDVVEAADKADDEGRSSPGLHLALSGLDLHLALKRLREETP